MIHWPRCALCDKPVDEVITEEEPLSRRFVVTVRCHGATESCELPTETLVAAEAIVDAVAFRTAALPSA